MNKLFRWKREGTRQDGERYTVDVEEDILSVGVNLLQNDFFHDGTKIHYPLLLTWICLALLTTIMQGWFIFETILEVFKTLGTNSFIAVIKPCNTVQEANQIYNDTQNIEGNLLGM